jgi:DNA-binding transcriptional LysR family regulator
MPPVMPMMRAIRLSFMAVSNMGKHESQPIWASRGQTEIGKLRVSVIHFRMKTREPGWELWRSFLAAVRERSLSGAARALGLTQPTLGRHIDELEQALGGIALFTRSQLGLVPTDLALDLVPHAEAMAATAAALVRAASGAAGAAQGVIRLTASEIVGAEVLPPILARFRERHPAVTIELALSNATEDLLRRDADIAVRMVRPKQSALVAKRIGEVALGLHAHRRYLAAHGTPNGLDEVARHAIIGFDRETPSARAVRALGLPLAREMFAFCSDSDLAQLAALRAGFGIGVCQLGIARRDPELVRVAPEAFSIKLEVWVVMHKDLRASHRMRLMFDHLAQALAGYVATSREAPMRRASAR